MHYTPKFKKAYEQVLKVAEKEGELAGRIAFRDAMVELGPDERLRNLYRIQDKLSRTATFFRPNPSQEKYLAKTPKRGLILKCRQIGYTTLNCLRAYDLVVWEPNSRTGILSHKKNLVETIFNDITMFTHQWFIKDWGHLYAPTKKSSTGSVLSFIDDGLGRRLDSSIRVMFDFRGKTLHFLHIAEASRVDPERLVGSINGVPDNGEITMESTANGRGGEFYEQWQNYKKMGKQAPYEGFFIPWFEHYPEVPEESRWQPPRDVQYDAYEQELLRQHPELITPQHLMWRRWCIVAKCNNSLEQFEEEYPTNDVDCFRSGADNVFGNSVIKKQEVHCNVPLKEGFLVPDGKKIEFLPDPKGVTTVWKEPVASHTYVIGADTAAGIGRDRAAAYVKDQKTGEYVARIWGDIEPKDFANELYKIGTLYNKAWICPEVNNHGHVTVHVLKELGYSNLYKRAHYDELIKRQTRKIGYQTSSANKIMLTENFKNACRDGTTKIPDQDLITEMSTFMQYASKTGRAIRREAAPGCHDDLVMAACFTEEMDLVRPARDDFEEYWNENPFEGLHDPDTGFVAV